MTGQPASRPEADAAPVHIVGVGGVGMSAVAQLLLDQGRRVSGSDREADRGTRSPHLDRLVRAGLALVPQDGSGVTPGTREVVVSTAIEPGNPDLDAALAMGVLVRHRSEPIADAMQGRSTVAVAGTSGKTTVTGMLGWILECAGHDPLVINGGAVMAWQGPARIGSVRWSATGPAVVEADESDRSFLRFRPDVAIVTNLSADHFGIGETRALFGEFLAGVKGLVVSPPGLDLPGQPGLQGLDETVQGLDDPEAFTYRGLSVRLQVPGRHNRENAGLALRTAEVLGVRPAVAVEALAGFRGIERRLQPVGMRGGVQVFDDYAHNPAKISASLTALQEMGSPVLAIWRPHGFGPLRAMQSDLAQALARVLRPEDRMWVLPVYDAGGTADRTVTPGPLVSDVRARGRHAEEAASLEEAAHGAVASARAGAVVATMGARDPDLPGLARRILEALPEA